MRFLQMKLRILPIAMWNGFAYHQSCLTIALAMSPISRFRLGLFEQGCSRVLHGSDYVRIES